MDLQIADILRDFFGVLVMVYSLLDLLRCEFLFIIEVQHDEWGCRDTVMLKEHLVLDYTLLVQHCQHLCHPCS